MGNLVYVLADIEEFDHTAFYLHNRHPVKRAQKYVGLRVIDSAGYPIYEFAFDEVGDEILFVEGKLKIPNLVEAKKVRKIDPSGRQTDGARIYMDYKHVNQMNSNLPSYAPWYQMNDHERRHQEMLYRHGLRPVNPLNNVAYIGNSDPKPTKKNNSILLLL